MTQGQVIENYITFQVSTLRFETQMGNSGFFISHYSTWYDENDRLLFHYHNENLRCEIWYKLFEEVWNIFNLNGYLNVQFIFLCWIKKYLNSNIRDCYPTGGGYTYKLT